MIHHHGGFGPTFGNTDKISQAWTRCWASPSKFINFPVIRDRVLGLETISSWGYMRLVNRTEQVENYVYVTTNFKATKKEQHMTWQSRSCLFGFPSLTSRHKVLDVDFHMRSACDDCTLNTPPLHHVAASFSYGNCCMFVYVHWHLLCPALDDPGGYET